MMTKAFLDALLIIGGTGLFCGIVLGIASRLFEVKEDPRVEAMLNLLPGVNCGACGYAGCLDYAKAIILDGAGVVECKPGGQETVEKIAEFMGVEAQTSERKAALVLCAGDNSKAASKFEYNGIADCKAAEMVGGGDKACSYGCLGLGTCSRVCPAHAIEITENRLAIVHPKLCIECGLCVTACPRHLIKLVPASRTVHVLCKSKDRGPVVKKKCSVGCIGCSICAKQTDAITMEGTLAVMNYDKPMEDDSVIEKCPQGTIAKRPEKKAEVAA